MNIYGIRILDKMKSHKDPSIQFLNVSLSGILEGIAEGSSYHWMLIFLDGSPTKGCELFLVKYMHNINHFKNGLCLK